MLILSLFPGIGLLDMAFEQEGFCVVRGPDLLWGGDIKRFHPPAGRFDGVIGGPPCQRFSRLQHMVRHRHPDREAPPDLFPEFERVVRQAQPRWFLTENVPAAPLPSVEGFHVCSLLLNNREVGGVQNRERRFCFGLRGGKAERFRVVDYVALQPAEYSPAVTASGGGRVCIRLGGSGKEKPRYRVAMKYHSFAESCRMQGLPDGFDLPGFSSKGKFAAVGNGVPLPMGRAIARAVKRAVGGQS